jgi:hypothetical protein
MQFVGLTYVGLVEDRSYGPDFNECDSAYVSRQEGIQFLLGCVCVYGGLCM